MTVNLVSILKNVGINTGYFFLGFITGTIIDLVFALIYKKIDPERVKYSPKVIFVLIIQLLVLIAVLYGLLALKKGQSGDSTIHTFMIHFGFVTSQFYLFDYLSKYIGSLLMKYPNKFPLRPVRDIQKNSTYETDENA
jgi:hypothetical protein